MSFFECDVRVVTLAEWLDWAGEVKTDVFVALPMIQRGSVWKPNQIIELWDSLLQGMPIGSLMISELQPGTPVRRHSQKKSELIPKGGGLGLIDGQQRTLAMLAAWPLAVKINRRIWIDFADEPTPGQLLRLRVTTTNQPFGFRRDDSSKKLSLDDRRKAQEKHESGVYDKQDEKKVPPANLENAWPYTYGASLPVDLRWLIETWRNCDPNGWEVNVLGKIEEIKAISEAISADVKDKSIRNRWPEDGVIKLRIGELKQALIRVFQMKLPLIRVDNRFFDTKNIENRDPPLALLFKRVGTGGTKLSDEDYVYSIIKHLHAKAYDLVESLYEPQGGKCNVASLLTSTDLVVSAVRLAVANWLPSEGQAFPDRENLKKQDFHKLLGRGDFLKEQFLPLIEPAGNEKLSPIVQYFEQVQKCLEYIRDKNDIGLPRYLFPHIGRPLVQVLLRIAQMGYLAGELSDKRRNDVIRLVLFWMVAVNDQSKASEIAYRVIKNEIPKDPSIFEKAQIGQKIHDALINQNVAVGLIHPSVIDKRHGLSKSPEDPKILRGKSRFNPVAESEKQHQHVYDFYRQWWRPWTYHHPMLLWLQREYVEGIEGDPMAGREEDTPYDYDHILPSSHWADWRGPNGSPLSFAQGEIGIVGNGIGNVRVWGSSNNRSDGDTAPSYKLRLIANMNEDNSALDKPPAQQDLLRLSAIPDNDEHKNAWLGCSSVTADKRTWNTDRTIAFQTASELRTFHLYERYFSELKFSEWCNKDDSQGGRALHEL